MRPITRRILTFAAALLPLASPAFAQSYPARAIKLVVPFGPGGSADAIARPLAEKLGAALGQTVVVDNRPGGLTVIGAEIVAKSPPDGYTLYLMPGTHMLLPYMVKQVPFDLVNDFTPIAMLGSQPDVVFVNVERPYKTFREMIDYAKAHPGDISIGVSDVVTRVVASALEQTADVKFTIVPYKGGGPQNVDLVGNQIAGAVGTPNMMPFVQQGKMRALAATTPRRASFLPDVPTVAELFPGSNFDVQTWYAVVGPAKLPAPIVDKLSAAIAKVVADPAMRKRLDELGIVAPTDTSPAATLETMKSYPRRMAKFVEAAGIQPE
jgi:tripartite-type tricarboxylate transporter receptor subunit TctC